MFFWLFELELALANPGLKLNSLFGFMYFYTSVSIETSEMDTTVNKLLGFFLNLALTLG